MRIRMIAVFQKELGENELYTLNEGVRQLLKTELGSFFTEYLQNQLMTKGMVILRDKIRFYEGQKLLDSLAETWDFFFCDVLSMLQAIFYPVQVCMDQCCSSTHCYTSLMLLTATPL
ncbi:unnamed protein product [Boreogadus saida]